MTREEAIEYLDGMKIGIPICNELKELTDERNEAIDMAIEALSADAVQGEWQRVDEQPYFRKHYHKVCCSVCHKQGSEKYNFCPNCGSRMKEGAE